MNRWRARLVELLTADGQRDTVHNVRNPSTHATFEHFEQFGQSADSVLPQLGRVAPRQDDNLSVEWGERYTALTLQWAAAGKRSWGMARRLAWGELQNQWHAQHGRRYPTWRCAGCDAPIGSMTALALPDGNRVHFEPIACLIAFGKRWRGDATAALVALGLDPLQL